MAKLISKTVWILSFVSLFNDMGTEMLYPIMPIFLKTIGFSYLLIGILEGIAEAVAGLSKPYFGKMSDSIGRRLPFVQLGYGLSVISRPLMAVFVYPLWIFFTRSLDKIGKGVRTAARDAMLSDEATPQTKARVFGLHRAMDTLGAVIGPAIALLYLSFYPEQYKTLFLIAFIPGLLVMLSTLLIKEKKKQPAASPAVQLRKKSLKNIFAFVKYWKQSPAPYRQLVIGLLLFALFNSSDAFLLLKMKDTGLNDKEVIGVYIFYNMIYALMSYPLAALADRIGMKKILLSGLFIFALVYAGFAFNTNIIVFFVLFALYGIYAAATEGISKAWISNMVDKTETATAIGTFTGFQSLATLIASSLTGFLWFRFGATVAFLIPAAITLISIFYLSGIRFSAPDKL